jgi:hypothetical protein
MGETKFDIVSMQLRRSLSNLAQSGVRIPTSFPDTSSVFPAGSLGIF